MNHSAPFQQQVDDIIRQAFAEDIGSGDHTSLATIPAGTQGGARCLVKDTGTLAGVAFARRAFELLDPAVQFNQLLEDGISVKPGDVAFTVTGSTHSLLAGERLVLNVMQRMSGVATQARRAVDLTAGTRCRILDTRKTTPLIRVLEKWAVRIGGGVNHRFGLFDMILIKDNHVDFAGGIAQALTATRSYLSSKGLSLAVEIETRNLAEVEAVLSHGEGLVQRILLDNMTPEQLRTATHLVAGRFETEASGGITLDNLAEVAATGVDFISMGSLTHSVKSLDISLKAL